MSRNQEKKVFSTIEMAITLAGIITGSIPIAIAGELAEPAYEYLVSRNFFGDRSSDAIKEQYLDALKETFSLLKSSFNNEMLQDIKARLEYHFDKQIPLTPENIHEAIQKSVIMFGEGSLSESVIEKIYSDFFWNFYNILSKKNNSLNGIVIGIRIDRLQTIIDLMMKDIKELQANVTPKNTASFFDSISKDDFHYKIFNTDIDIEKYFIEGNYKILTFDNHSCEQYIAVVESCLKILNEQRYLFIQGEYGSGKTMLTKMIQKRVEYDGYRTIYLSSTNFYRLLNQKVDLNKEFGNLIKKTYIFVDAMDELIGVTMDGKTDMETIIGNLSTALIYNNLYIVINSRPNVLCNGELMQMSDLIYFAFNSGKSNGVLVSMCEFKNEIIDKWLNDFLEGEYLTTSILKRSYKKILTSCRIPLFVYFLGLEYKQNNRVLEDVLLYYEKYIDSTITGKYNGELKQSMALMGFSMFEYRNLLRRIAFEVCSKYEYNPEEVEVNKNYPYFFNFNQLSDTTKHSIVSKTDVNKWIPNILNCYFFKVFELDSTKIICFSDYNVMCFLAAEYLFEIIKTFSYDCLNENQIDELKKINYIKLNPVVMDTLMLKMRELEKRQIDNILYNIKNIITKCLEDNISRIALNIQILLFIIYFKLNEGSYSENADRYFTYFECLCKMYKVGNPNNRFLEERYFMNTKFYNHSIKSFNCANYNFKNSVFREFEFVLSSFENSIFDNIELRDVKFIHSHFMNSTFCPKIMMNIEAKDCTFHDFKIKHGTTDYGEDKSKKMTLLNCQMHNVILDGLEDLSFKLRHCVIENLCVKNCKKLSIYMENCLLITDINISSTSGRLNSFSRDIFNKIKRHGISLNDFKLLESKNQNR